MMGLRSPILLVRGMLILCSTIDLTVCSTHDVTCVIVVGPKPEFAKHVLPVAGLDRGRVSRGSRDCGTRPDVHTVPIAVTRLHHCPALPSHILVFVLHGLYLMIGQGVYRVWVVMCLFIPGLPELRVDTCGLQVHMHNLVHALRERGGRVTVYVALLRFRYFLSSMLRGIRIVVAI